MAPEPHMRRSVVVALKLLDHFGGDAEGDGIGRDVVGDKTEGSHNRVFAYGDARHDNTVSDQFGVSC